MKLIEFYDILSDHIRNGSGDLDVVIVAENDEYTLVANEIDPDLISPVDNGNGGYDLEIRAFSSF